MTNQQHPITPPPELIEKWHSNSPLDRSLTVATQAARWGSDQELEACVKWVSEYCLYFGDYPLPEDKLRSARRPKPPSLKEQALALVEQHEDGWRPSPKDWDIIRRALEQLDD